MAELPFYDWYTDPARRAVELAAAEAGSNQPVSTGHLLLGLLRSEGMAPEVLKRLGITIDTDAARQQLAEVDAEWHPVPGA